MPARAVTLPTPEQERKAILGLMGLMICSIAGVVALVFGGTLALIGLARLVAGWVFG